MEKTQKHYGKSCLGGPAGVLENSLELRKAGIICKNSGCHVSHEHYGNENLVGWKAENKSHHYDAIHSYKPAEGLEKINGQAQKRDISQPDISHYPYNQAGGSRYTDCPGKDEKGSVKKGADDDASHLRPSVGRKLQNKGG